MVSKAGQQDASVHRLTDMLVEEVSLVDRPANKRKFLVVKRSEEMGTEVKPAGNGSFSTGNGAGVDKAGGAYGAPPDDKKKKPPMTKALELPPGFKEMMGPILDKAAERMTALSDTINGASAAEVGDDGTVPPVPEEVWSELMAIMQLISQVEGMYPKAPAEPEEGAGEGGAEATGEAGVPAATEMQLRMRAMKTLFDIVDARGAVAKVGAKMSKERYARLEQALAVLNSLLGELAPAPMGEGGPSELSMADKKKAADKKDKKDDPTEKRFAALEQGMGEVVKAVERLAGVVRKNDTELTSVRKARGPGNGLVIDGAPSQRDPNEVSWPLDMNAEVTRDNVNKQESFFDD